MKLARVCFLVLPLFALTAQAQLGSAGMFGVLGASAVTNTGDTVIDGDLGVYPGTSITGFPPGIVNGTIYDGDAVAMQAQTDALAAYNFFLGLSSNENLTGQNLGGLELTPGVYSFNSSAQLTGALTINWEGLSNQSVVFQIGSTLTTASASMVMGINMRAERQYLLGGRELGNPGHYDCLHGNPHRQRERHPEHRCYR